MVNDCIPQRLKYIIWGGVVKFVDRNIVLTDKEDEREINKREVIESNRLVLDMKCVTL